jgi:hypothetical protein
MAEQVDDRMPTDIFILNREGKLYIVTIVWNVDSTILTIEVPQEQETSFEVKKLEELASKCFKFFCRNIDLQQLQEYFQKLPEDFQQQPGELQEDHQQQEEQLLQLKEELQKDLQKQEKELLQLKGELQQLLLHQPVQAEKESPQKKKLGELCHDIWIDFKQLKEEMAWLEQEKSMPKDERQKSMYSLSGLKADLAMLVVDLRTQI